MIAEEIQLAYKLIVIFLYSFFLTTWSVPYIRHKLISYDYLVEDKYKPGKPKVATMGGLTMLVGIVVSLALSQILLNRSGLGDLFIFYFVIVIYGLYGVVDDLFSFRQRYDKILVLMVLTFPIASLISDTVINLGFTTINLGLFYPLLIIPAYIMVIANMINLHAGYNGLTQGLSVILMLTLGIKSYMLYGIENLIYLMPLLGAAIAFFPHTFNPAKLLPGNVGDFLIGAGIGAFIVINQILWFGVVIFIPHIINFMMDTWTLLIRKRKDVKFGTLRPDNTIEAPPTMKYKSLKFLIVSWFRLSEKQATYGLYGFTLLFCIIGLLFF